MATRIWTATAAGGAWNDPNNWTANQIPGAGDKATFPPGAYTVTVVAGVNEPASGALARLTIGPGVTISGSGKINAFVFDNSGAVEASGGRLILNGLVTGGTLEIGAAAGDRLTLRTHGSNVANVSFLGVSGGTLEIGSHGSLNIASALDLAGNTLKLDSAAGHVQVTDAAGITLAGGTIAGGGTLGSTTPISGFGTINIQLAGGSGAATAGAGGVLDFHQSVDASGATAFKIAAGGDLKFDSTVGAAGNNQTLTFESGTGTLDLSAEGNLANFHGVVAGLQATGSTSALSDNILVAGSGAAGDKLVLNGSVLTIENASGAKLESIKLSGSFTQSEFHITQNGGVDDIWICFMAGTRIRTPQGEAAVETLKRGDLVLTADGLVKPIRWIGRQTVSAAFADPSRAWPIRVKAGALGRNVPVRDLLISPDHALLVEGALIQAGALVNGTSITRETKAPRAFVYYHVELDDHSLILAEGAAAETFIDNVDRLAFDNWFEHEALFPHGRKIEELPYPRARAHRQVPVEIRVKLAERAQAIGGRRAAVA